jgi:large subunit ribosomal protein L21
MYAVIRTGGKQYRVAPGDVVKIEKTAAGENGAVEFSEVLAVSGDADSENKSLAKPSSAKVVGTVLDEGRAAKILVFGSIRSRSTEIPTAPRSNAFNSGWSQDRSKGLKKWHTKKVLEVQRTAATQMLSGWE